MQQQYFLDQTYTINTTKIYKNINKIYTYIQKYTKIYNNIQHKNNTTIYKTYTSVPFLYKNKKIKTRIYRSLL